MPKREFYLGALQNKGKIEFIRLNNPFRTSFLYLHTDFSPSPLAVKFTA